MSSQKPSKRKQLYVSVSFEASRLADECLANAYEQVVPIISRAKIATNRSTPASIAPAIPAENGYCDFVTDSKQRVAE